MLLKDHLNAAGRGATSLLAQQIQVPTVLISQWANGIRPIPEGRCPAIERATSGAVTCEELAPKSPWRRVPDAAWPHPQGRPVLDFGGAGPAAC